MVIIIGRILNKVQNATLSLGQLQQLAHTTSRIHITFRKAA